MDFSCSIKSTCNAVSPQKVKIWCKLSSLLPRLRKQNPSRRVGWPHTRDLFASRDRALQWCWDLWAVSWAGLHLQPTRMWLFISQRLSSFWRLFELWKSWKHWGNPRLGWFTGANWLPAWLQKQIPHTSTWAWSDSLRLDFNNLIPPHCCPGSSRHQVQVGQS